MTNILIYIAIGLTAGALSGLIGIGGGIIIVPALVLLLGLSQQMAQGTTLAVLIPPIGILAAWTYFKNGHVDIKIAAFICLGFIFGALFGAQLANKFSNVVLTRIFGVTLMAISVKMIFFK
jgi:uncharacterized protein